MQARRCICDNRVFAVLRSLLKALFELKHLQASRSLEALAPKHHATTLVVHTLQSQPVPTQCRSKEKPGLTSTLPPPELHNASVITQHYTPELQEEEQERGEGKWGLVVWKIPPIPSLPPKQPRKKPNNDLERSLAATRSTKQRLAEHHP